MTDTAREHTTVANGEFENFVLQGNGRDTRVTLVGEGGEHHRYAAVSGLLPTASRTPRRTTWQRSQMTRFRILPRNENRRRTGVAARPVRALGGAVAAVTLAVLTAAAHSPDAVRPHLSPAGSTAAHSRLTAPGHTTVAAPPPADDERAEVVRLVNALRAEAGCSALAPHPALEEAARDHSASMARTGELSHRGSGGRSLMRRLKDTGYAWSQVGENIAYGYPDAAAVVAGWMDSPPHRRNILACGHRDIGVGLAHGHDTTWWTQITGARR
ncbi:CAP domain-containing protein [Streptomyces sp. CNQ085]|uniref:CAP domain-containing protein n=1 Tax=Streptomyces sp. CNQ085 TaxID=2886944 RepID=UPI001F508FE7|nr:CAP domain-containing protein [Streptomyces sp. CNQ085]MCI0387010.1 CAP domain-containing protein [Streptomyces sp. CNQ085]